jgi:hypothetical protein
MLKAPCAVRVRPVGHRRRQGRRPLTAPAAPRQEVGGRHLGSGPSFGGVRSAEQRCAGLTTRGGAPTSGAALSRDEWITRDHR